MRIGAHMARYLQSRLTKNAVQLVKLLGGDARTGVSVCRTIDPRQVFPARHRATRQPATGLFWPDDPQ
jgi:hypothetical protein